MERKVYTINKGINRPIEFRGLRAQYIGYLAAAVVGALVVFTTLCICGVPSFIAVPLALGLGGILMARVYGMNRRYGEDGLMKRRAREGMPTAMLSKSRECFIKLYGDACEIGGSVADPRGGGGLHGE
jgi:hypothetical protein